MMTAIMRKIRNRYMGPYCVIRETKGKAYVLEEMNGNMLCALVAAFRLVPYIKQEHLDGWVRLVEVWDQNQPEESDSSTNEMEAEGD